MSTYDFHPEVRLDLDEIWEFIRGDNLDAADRLIAEILDAIDALVPFPGRGHRRPDLTSRPLRFILVREYLIVYAPDEKPLWIVAVMHGRRSPRVMAAILRQGVDASTVQNVSFGATNSNATKTVSGCALVSRSAPSVPCRRRQE
jgi:plasmid stabilization system protein ParE